MVDKLRVLLKRSYSPYSYFRVSAVLVSKDGREFYGVNVENASYGATICAERNAIFSAITHGYTKGDFDKLYLMVDSDKISFPCNSCRQVFTEFLNEDTEIICYNIKGQAKRVLVKDLCPYSFGEDDLL